MSINLFQYGFGKQLPHLAKNTIYLAMQQTHSPVIKSLKIDKQTPSQVIKKTDGLILQLNTNQPVCLSVKTADCLPILAYSHKDKVMAAIHMGYQGAYQGILANFAKKLKDHCVDLAGLNVVFGPSINGACYNIPMSRYAQFQKRFANNAFFLFNCGKEYFLSLSLFAFWQLQSLGIAKQAFSWQLNCTHCQKDRFYSFRRNDRQVNNYNYLIYG